MTVLEFPTHPRLRNALSESSIFVHKFGGTSLGSAGAITSVSSLLEQFAGHQIAVVSAFSGVTNMLVESTRSPADEIVNKLRIRHHEILTGLIRDKRIDSTFHSSFVIKLDADLAKIAHCLEALVLTNGQVPDVFQALVWGFGEIWSAEIVAAVCRAPWINAREFLFLRDAPGQVRIDWERSGEAWRRVSRQLIDCPIIIVTGFICSTDKNCPATLNRNGSDHSAAIIANLVDAALLTIWKEVDGAFSADPRQVKDAVMLDQLSYHEAAELAYFGANVLHPATMQPCVTKKIPIVIRNTFNQRAQGTLITNTACVAWTRPCKAFTTIPSTALVNIEGSSMVGVKGTAVRVFQAAYKAGVNIVMITQASSEHSITIAVVKSEVDRCKKALDTAFFYEISEGNVSVTVDDHTAILTAVGDDMAHQPGLLGRLAGALGHAGVSIRAIAQGASERNITFVVAADSATAGILAMHDEIYC
jgi:aspartokinase/homoserine dehydrogenase 1